MHKDKQHRVWCGVLAGLAKHFDEDPALFRIGYCIFTLVTGFWIGLIIYFIMAMCIPAEDEI